MDISIVTNKLIHLRQLRSNAHIEEFEGVVQRVMETKDPRYLMALCYGLDDNTEQHDVTFSLIHSIEAMYRLDERVGLRCLMEEIPNILPFAKDWVDILHYRILNNAHVRKVYKDILGSLKVEKKNVLLDILGNIKEEDPSLFSDSVNEIINA